MRLGQGNRENIKVVARQKFKKQRELLLDGSSCVSFVLICFSLLYSLISPSLLCVNAADDALNHHDKKKKKKRAFSWSRSSVTASAILWLFLFKCLSP